MKEPFATLLWNLSGGAIGIVPYGNGDDINRASRSAPGRFALSAPKQDKEVIIERNPDYWGAQAKFERVVFKVIPTPLRARSNCAKAERDIAINALAPTWWLRCSAIRT